MNLLVNIDVDDLAEATRFYGAALGLTIGRRLGEAAVEMLGGPVPIWLLLKAADTQASPASAGIRSFDRHWTPIHLDFVVEDIESAVRTAVTAGARSEQAISTHPWGRLALMADPFGHGFCFVQFVGRGYDEIAN